MSMTVTLDTSGPCDPQYVLEVAGALAESVRVLNTITRDPGALGQPSDADRLIRELLSMAERLPQLLGQIGSWLAAEVEAGRIDTHAAGLGRGPVALVAGVRIRLGAAAASAGEMRAELAAAASATSDMGAAETDGEGDGR